MTDGVNGRKARHDVEKPLHRGSPFRLTRDAGGRKHLRMDEGPAVKIWNSAAVKEERVHLYIPGSGFSQGDMDVKAAQKLLAEFIIPGLFNLVLKEGVPVTITAEEHGRVVVEITPVK